MALVGNRFEERGLTYTPVGNDEILLVVPGRHPWATRPSVKVDELVEAPFIARESGSGTAKAVVEALAQAGVDVSKQKIRLSVGSNYAVKAAVIAGVGISFLSDLAVRSDVDRGDLAVVPVEGLQILRHFCIVRRTNRELSPAASAFWDLMIGTYG